MNLLTDRQQDIYKFIKRAIDRDGVPPLQREIAQRFGVSWAVVHQQLVAMESKGVLTWERGDFDTLRLTGE